MLDHDRTAGILVLLAAVLLVPLDAAGLPFSGGGTAGVDALAVLFTLLLWRLSRIRRDPPARHFKLPKDWQ